MSIYKSAVNKPITTFMVFTAIIVMGIYSLTRIPIDLYPEIDPPFLSVMTTYSGANAADIETNVTKRLEDALNSVDNVKEVTSTSSDNLSVINLEFTWGANLDEATNEVRDVIDRIYDYMPDGADRPSIFKFNTSMMPIVFYAVTAHESYPGLEKLLQEKIINPLNRVEGVGSVSMIGVPKRLVYVDADPNKLDAYGLTIEQIGNTIAGENMNMPSGNIKMGEMDYQLRIQGEFTDSRQLKDLVVGNKSGIPVYLRDVASVRDTLKDLSLDEKINGETGLRMFVVKQSGANTVKVAREINENVKILQETLPPDVKLEMIMDTSNFIKGSINNLSETLMWAFIFVVLVVLFFLGKWRATFIIVLTIPISLIVSFIYLFMTGNSINVISLTSLSIAIGMVVDDAIVVLENITKHIERGSSPREAAIYATNEVWLSVIITTLVVVAVFFPLTMVGGMTGVMFKQLGWIVSITVVTSTLAAITLTPMLASKLLVLRTKSRPSKWFSYNRTIEPMLNAMDNFYERTLRWALRHKTTIMLTSLGIFIISLLLMRFVGTDFMPQTDESRLNATIELQTGTRVEETIKTTRKLEKIIKERYPEVIIISSSSGSDDEGSIFSLFSSTGSNIINIMARLKGVDERERDVWEIADDLREQIAGIPEIVTASVSTTSGGMGMGTSNTVDVEIYGYDFNATNLIANEIKLKLNALEDATDIKISRKNDKPELQIILDKEKLTLHGLNSAGVSTMIRNRINGMTASQFKEEGDEYEIRVRLAEEFRNSITELENLTIITPMGKELKLKEIGKVDEYWGPPAIQHKRKERIVTVSAMPKGVSLGQLATEINKVVNEVKVPQEVMIQVGGAYEDQQESFMDLGLLMVMSLILVFIVMASQFESFTMPFIIMFSIPFAFTGVIFALLITGTTLSIVAALGAVLLIGIVVKNGIVLVDFTNLMRDRDMRLYDAIVVSGKSRLRPVLMTAMTTILGMLPLALSTGEGSEIWRPMGITVIGGLVFSTIVTMVIVPVMYGVLARSGERDKVTKLRKKFQNLN
ncbi:MAG: efflux RND transporter permease subunit [Lentimicrobium sp.]|jgi:HAE1 family hydrophobic/amphiphilic exporter-1|nr:efflux RND transporter permease subunit [Lentimicrobium sp.]